jgi:hypothetical protein
LLANENIFHRKPVSKERPAILTGCVQAGAVVFLWCFQFEGVFLRKNKKS